MPFYLTSTANPSSPQSWVKMETESIVSMNSEYGQLRFHPAATTNPRQPLQFPPLTSPSGSLSPRVVGNGLDYHDQPRRPSPLQNQNLGSSFNSFSLNRNLNRLNLAVVPRTNSVFANYAGAPSRKMVDSNYERVASSLAQIQERKQGNIEDNDWGDNTTAVTGLSDLGCPPGPIDNWGEDFPGGGGLDARRSLLFRNAGLWTGVFFSAIALLSPVIMVILPHTPLIGLRESQKKCDMGCNGLIVGLSFKLFILLTGSWALFFRASRSTLPRVRLYRAGVCTLLFIFLLAFWLFYWAQIVNEHHRRIKYEDTIRYASTMVDTLIFIHYLAVILLELKHSDPQFYIKVLRSPDGASKSYAIGGLSIQRAAAWVLDKYYTDFPIYNSCSDNPMSNYYNLGPKSSCKFYDVDRSNSVLDEDHIHSNRYASRISKEMDYERKVKKRKDKLITATENAFSHLGPSSQGKFNGPKVAMNPSEAAKAIFACIARPLQKYLRATRQQSRHTMESILRHLEICLKFGMSANAFLERYTSTAPVLQSDREKKPIQPWTISCDTLLSRNLTPGLIFQLRQGPELSLLCEIHQLPYLDISEETNFQSPREFSFRNTSESPV